MEPTHSQVILVTGGAQGIGKAVALHLLINGMAVIIADIDREAGEETEGELRALGDIRFIPTDVADEASVKTCLAKIIQQHDRIHALVNNAGIGDPHGSPVDMLSLERWYRIIGVNLTGSFLMVKHAVPHLRKSRGAIVNIASTRALQSEANTEAYAASKGGIVALTHALAISLGSAVRVNCISPGWIDVSKWQKKKNRREEELRPEDHRQHPAGRVGQPEDIAAMVAYLISDSAEFITGQNFIIDGGMTRKMIYEE